MQPCPIPVPGQVAAERVVIGLQGAAEGKQNVALLDDVGRNGAGPGQRHAPHQEETRADSKIGYNTSFFQRGGGGPDPPCTHQYRRASHRSLGGGHTLPVLL